MLNWHTTERHIFIMLNSERVMASSLVSIIYKNNGNSSIMVFKSNKTIERKGIADYKPSFIASTITRKQTNKQQEH